MASKPAIQLPDLPDDWFQDVTGAPAADTGGQASGVLGGLPPQREWSPADSGLSLVMSPDEIKMIDFSGTTTPEPPPWQGGTAHGATAQPDPWAPQPSGEGFYTGLTPYQPDPGAPRMFRPGPNKEPGQDWVQLPRPGEMESGEHGSGYYVYGTDDTGRVGTTARGQWGRPKAMEVIGAVADRLATGDAYTPFGVGNMSLPTGGPFKGHNGHKDGLGIDVRPARVDGAQQPVTYRDKQYDRAATQRMVDAFRATGQVDKIYFNDPMIRGVQPWKEHDNHVHVQIKQ